MFRRLAIIAIFASFAVFEANQALCCPTAYGINAAQNCTCSGDKFLSQMIVNPYVVGWTLLVFLMLFLLLRILLDYLDYAPNVVQKFQTKQITLVTLLVISILAGFHIFSAKIIHPPWHKHFPGSKLPEIKRTSSRFQIMNGVVSNPKTDHNIEYDDIIINSTQNGVAISLHGWLVKSKTPKGIGIIFAHGGGDDRRHFLRHLELFHEEGFDCIMFDFNGHGTSGGDSLGISYGLREHVDILNVVRFSKEKLGWNKVILCGNSVGASSAIIAAALDNSIDLVIAENPYSDLFSLWGHAVERLLGNENFGKTTTSSFGYGMIIVSKISKLIPKSFLKLLFEYTYWRIAGSKSYDEWSPEVLVSKVKQPIMFMHGLIDTVIPVSHSQDLFLRASHPKEIFVCEFSGHGQIFNAGKERYRQVVIGFVIQHLK